MKRTLLTAAVIVITFMSFTNPPTVNEKVLTSFNDHFSNTSDVVWTELGIFYEVNFVQNNIKARVKYDATGNIVESIRYYGEEMLPLMVKSKLHNRYPGKKVFGVTEVAKDGELSYYVVLEDDKSWITVQSDHFGQTSIHSKYKK